MWWCHIPQEKELTSAELAAIDTEELRQRLVERFKGWHEPIETFLANTPDIIRTNIYETPPLPAWHRDRVVLIGDAAHAMSPSGGQGASMVAGGRRDPGQTASPVFGRVRTAVCGIRTHSAPARRKDQRGSWRPRHRH
jgi:hypothetical protein